MAKITTIQRGATIDPLKHSQPLGATLVFLGLAGAMPIMHGAQGCASFAKALLTRHFNEPIPLQTTAITEVTAVVGSGEAMVATLDAIRKRQRPDIIGLLTTGVTEVSGEDVGGQLRAYLADWAEADADADGAGPDGTPGSAVTSAPLIVGVSSPDFDGGLTDGWSAALEALVRAVLQAPADDAGDRPAATATCLVAASALPEAPGSPDATAGSHTPGDTLPGGRVAVLVGPGFTAADLDEFAGLVRGFGLTPVLVPDLSSSVDGHLAADWQPTTTGGTTVAELRSLGEVDAVLVAGAAADAAGKLLATCTGRPLLRHAHLSGLTPMDALVSELMTLTGRSAPREVRRARARLADGLLDAHFVLGGVRVAIAAEPDLLVAAGSLLRDVGAEIVTAMAPAPAAVLAEAPWDEVVIGDLGTFAERAQAAGAELLIGSSHLREIADRIGAAFLPLGFPIFDRLGATLAGTAGYTGSLRLLLDAANRVLDHGHADHGHADHGQVDHGLAPARSGDASTGSALADGRSVTDTPRQPGATADPDELDNLFQESPC